MKIVKNLAFITIVSLPLYVIRCKDFIWCVSPIPFTLLEVLILITFSVWVAWITHSIRKKMADVLQSRKDIYIFDKHKSPKSFVKTMIQSYIALCPRGYGGSSFRFFEAMQLGVVPFLIGEFDTRPFKKYIPFDEFSFFTNDPNKISDIIDSKNKEELLTMGKKCIRIYKENLAYQKWCELVIKTLDDRR